MIAYADDIAINICNMGELNYTKMTTALERIGYEAARLGQKFYEAIWYRSKNPESLFRISGEVIPWSHQ